MPSCCRSLLLCTAVALCGGFPLVGQEIPKRDYVTYLPRATPRAVTRPAANVTFQLYGNPAGAAWRAAGRSLSARAAFSAAFSGEPGA